MGKLLYQDETYAVRGAAIEVHKQLGFGFLEAVYQEALEIELAQRGIPFESQKALSVTYKGQRLKKHYIADIVCIDKFLVELKCVPKFTDVEKAQLLNYLAVTGMRVGLIINFRSRGKLEIERLAM
jgi:GxxExxY protein